MNASSASVPSKSSGFAGARTLLAMVWLVFFSAFFFSRTLPNNPEFNRLDLLLNTHLLLLENVAPAGDDPGRANVSGWSYLPQRFDLLLVAGGILASALALGHLILRLLRMRTTEYSAARSVFAVGLGLSGWSLATLLLGLAGGLVRPLLIGLMAASVATECWFRLRGGEPFWWRRRYLRESQLAPAIILTVTPFLLAMLLGAMLPSVDFDVKEYHLEGPKEYFQSGQITFLPHNVYTSFPFLTEMLSLLAMVLRDDWYRGALAGKVVLMSFAPLTALAVYAGGRLIRPSVGLLGALIFLTTPWVYRTSVIAYTEGGLAFFLMATLLAILTLTPIVTRDVPERRRAYLLAGLLTGSAMACKYPGVLSVALPMGLAVVCATLFCSCETGSRLSRLPARARAGGLFIVGALVTFGPWAVKNWCQTRNPVYPLLYSMFGGADWSDALDAKWRAAHALPLEMLRTPSAWSGDLGRRFVDVAVLSDWQSVLVFGLVPLSLLTFTRHRDSPDRSATNTNRTLQFLWLYAAWLFLTWWGLTHRIDRFWVPMLPVLALLAGIGFDVVWRRLGELSQVTHWPPATTIGSGIVVVLVSVAVLFNLAFVTTGLGGYNAYLLDLNVAQQEATTRSIGILNRRLPPDSRVLLVGEAQVFDAEFEHVYNTVFDQSIFEDWFAASAEPIEGLGTRYRPAAEIRETLHEAGITHVFVNWAEVLRYREPGSYGYTDFAAPATFRDLVELQLLQPIALRPEESLMFVDRFSEGKRHELERWAPELLRNSFGEEVFLMYELFEVRDDE